MNRRTFLRAAGSAGQLSLVKEAKAADPALVKATQAVLDAIPLAESDPDRPVYHFHPPANWTNDPNGTFYYRGWHHLFYQLNPFAPRIGDQHWGHARSRDLVNWEHLPIAIWPSADRGELAIFSGGAAIAGDGKPRLIYTSISQRQPEQWMVLPKDEELLSWEKYPGNPVLTQAAHGAQPIAQWRDPFLFEKDGGTYMVCGGATVGGKAQVQLYRATKPDLSEWKHLGPIFQSIDRDVRNFECPNLFPLDNQWVLIVSPNRVCEYWIGTLDIGRMQFTPSAHGVLDAGDAYASNISKDGKGRTLLWLWGRTNTPPGKGWGSVMTMPRVLSIGADGYLKQQPAPEFATLRGKEMTFPGLDLDKHIPIAGLQTDCAELEVVFSGTGSYGLELRTSAEGKPALTVSIERGYLNVGNVRSFVGNAERHTMRVFLDKRCAEVFVDGGTTALYKWFDAPPENLGVSVFGATPAAPGGGGGRGPAINLGGLPSSSQPNRATHPPRMESLRVWQLRPARFTLDKFKDLSGA